MRKGTGRIEILPIVRGADLVFSSPVRLLTAGLGSPWDQPPGHLPWFLQWTHLAP